MAFDLATHLKRTRQELGLSQAELAERAGMHQGDLSDIERGVVDPRWSTVQRLSQALGEVVGPTRSATMKSELSTEERDAMRSSTGRLRRDVPLIPVKR